MVETKLLLAELFAFQGLQVGQHLARKGLVQLKHLENVFDVQRQFDISDFGQKVVNSNFHMVINTWQSLSPNPALAKACMVVIIHIWFGSRPYLWDCIGWTEK